MIENITFNDTGKKVNITIDNETIPLAIQAIEKIPTHIMVNKSLNTPLNEDINIDASLCYITDTSEDEIGKTENEGIYQEENVNDIAFLIPDNKKIRKINTDGIVNIQIYDDNNVYYDNDIAFKRGDIQIKIANNLGLGEYKCKIKYAGSKYYDNSEIIINFSIDYRLAHCIFDTDTVSGHLSETIYIDGTLKDSLTQKIISNCTVQYDFNGKTASAITDDNGKFTMNITIPDGHILHCNQFALEEETIIIEPGDPYIEEYETELERDEDGNIVLKSDVEEPIPSTDSSETSNQNSKDFIYPGDAEEDDTSNTSYLITLSINNQSYYLKDESLIVNVIKAPTFLDINTGAYNQTNRTVNFNGHVTATVSDMLEDVHYGKVQIRLLDFNYIHDITKVDNHGLFTTDINMATVYQLYNQTEVDTLIPYQAYNEIYNTSLTLDMDENDKRMKVGAPIVAEASIKTSTTNELVTDGMVKFILYRNDEKIYTYATELDDVGVGVFAFNTSQSGTYTLKAKYYGLFGYRSSSADAKITVEG